MKEKQRVLKYAGNKEGRCPACFHPMWYEPQAASMPPRFRCICGFSIFNFPTLDMSMVNYGR